MELYYLKAVHPTKKNDLFLCYDNRGVSNGIDFYWISEWDYLNSPFVEPLVLENKISIINIQEKIAKEKLAYSYWANSNTENLDKLELLERFPVFIDSTGKFVLDMNARSLEVKKVVF